MSEHSAPPRPRIDIAPTWLLLLLGPVAVYLLLEFLLKAFGDATLDLPVSGFSEPAQLIELTGRYKFLAAFAFFGAVSVSVLLIFALDLAANYTRRSIGYALLGILLGASVGVVLSVLEPESLGAFETYYLLGRDFFEASLGLGQTAWCADGGPCLDRSAFSMFRILTNPINALTSFGAAAALTGMILSLGRPWDGDGSDIQSRAARLGTASAVAQRYLYLAGLLLSAGITFVLSWMYWPSKLIADDALRAAYGEMVSALSLYIGVGYSVMILSCYLPVMAVHTMRLDRLRADLAGAPALKPGQVPAKLPEISSVKSLNAIVAILSPVLASAIGGFGQGFLFQ